MVVLRGKRARSYVEDSGSDTNQSDDDGDAYVCNQNLSSDDDEDELTHDQDEAEVLPLPTDDEESLKPKRKIKRTSTATEKKASLPKSTKAKATATRATRTSSQVSKGPAKMKQQTLLSIVKRQKTSDVTKEEPMSDGEEVKTKSRASTSSAPPEPKKLKQEESKSSSDYSSNTKYAWLYNTCDAYGVPHSDPNSDPTTVTVPASAYRNMKDFEKQYWDIKKKYFDVVLLTKSGTFYEMYQTDALIGGEVLDFVVKEFAGMLRAGFYETAFLEKAAVLLQHGYKVGRVEQTEKRKSGSGAGLVNRELVQILTDATLMDDEMIGGYSSKILLAIKEDETKEFVGVAFSDASTATVYVSYIRLEELEALLYQVAPISVLCEHQGVSKELVKLMNQKTNKKLIYRRSHSSFSVDETRERIEQVFSDSVPESLTSYTSNDTTMGALGVLLGYLKYLLVDETILSSKNIIPFENTTLLTRAKRMVIDGQSLNNLEVLRNVHNNQRGTLVEFMNRAVTSQGKRLFERWLCSPLVQIPDIENRLACIEDLHHSSEVDSIRSLLSRVPDLERMLSKIHYEATVKKDAIMYDPKIEQRKVQLLLRTMSGFKKLESVSDKLDEISEQFQSSKMKQLVHDLVEACQLIGSFEKAFDHEKAVSEGKIYPNRGANAEYDAISDKISGIIETFTNELEELKSKCKAAKHVDSRKDIYLIEVPKNTKVPKDFQLVSETKLVSRYYSPLIKSKLKDLKELLTERTEKLEVQTKLMLQKFDSYHQVWRKAVDIGAEIDCLISLCSISFTSHLSMTRPTFVSDSKHPVFDLKQMTHPCIRSDQPVPNDTILGGPNNSSTIIVTGGNMAGKSSLLRQNCVAIIMAQMGCYVPAQRFTLTPVDRIFTRIGANDKIMAGESTFMVEMNETANILRNATDKSFVILDEMGRGTCTFDGISIAFSVIKYLAEKVRCRMLFSTHYSDLAEELKNHPLIDAYQMSFVEVSDARDGQRIIFTYQFVPGVCSKSYGMNVGRAAGIHPHIIQRAEYWADQYQKQLMAFHESKHTKNPSLSTPQTALFAELFNLITTKTDSTDRSQIRNLQASILNSYCSSFSNSQ